MGHLKLNCWCQLLTHLGNFAGRDALHLRRRLRLNQASDPVKSNISSATTNSKSRASLLPFIVIWKVKNKWIKRIRNKGIEKFHLLVGQSIRAWHNSMFSFKVISHKSSSELPKCDSNRSIRLKIQRFSSSQSCYKTNLLLRLANKKMTVQTLGIVWSGRSNKSWSWSRDVLNSLAPHSRMARSF